MSKKIPTKEEQLIFEHLYLNVSDQYRITKFKHDTQELCINIMTMRDKPYDNITTYSTIGLCDYPMMLNGKSYKARLEIIMPLRSTYKHAPNILAMPAFCVMRTRKLLYPGAVLPDYVAEYYPRCKLPHLYFTAPFLWESLNKIKIGKKIVCWLLAIPISDKEYSFLQKHSDQELESRFEKKQIDIFSLSRKSVV